MAITTLDALAAALPGQRFNFNKDDSTGLTAGRMVSLWRVTGSPGVGSDPGTTNGVVPTKSDAGAFNFVNPGAGLSYVGRLNAWAGQQGTLVVYDRVLHSNGFNATATPGAPVTVTRPAATQTNELFIEVYTATTTSRTVVVTYTDQAGNAAQVAATVTLLACAAGTMIPVPLAASDVGVQKIESVTCSGATGGSWGLTVANRIADVPFIVANVENQPDVLTQLGFPNIADNACIAMAFIPATTSTGRVGGGFSIAQG